VAAQRLRELSQEERATLRRQPILQRLSQS